MIFVYNFQSKLDLLVVNSVVYNLNSKKYVSSNVSSSENVFLFHILTLKIFFAKYLFIEAQ